MRDIRLAKRSGMRQTHTERRKQGDKAFRKSEEHNWSTFKQPF